MMCCLCSMLLLSCQRKVSRQATCQTKVSRLQVQLYLLLMSERYGRQVDAGLLHYLGSRDPKLIPYHHLTIQAGQGPFSLAADRP